MAVPSIHEVTTAPPPAPGAPITGLSHVQLVVSDAVVSARWYRAALGLQSMVEDADVGYVALKHRGAKLVVVLTTAPRRDPSQPVDDRGEHRDHLDHLAFAVPDGASLEAWAEHLTEIGIDHAGIVLENGHPSLQLRDPDGVAIELVAP
jgi:glyoxylase I family protein